MEKKDTWLRETVYTSDGKKLRIRSYIFYWGIFWSIVLGIILLSKQMIFGGFLILTASPFLLLYPIIRFLFGGKDSIGAVLTTAVVEELLKNEIKKSARKKKK